MGKIDKFIIDNTTYELVPEIAPLFNPATSYSIGDCVIYDAVLYKFTANHTGAWTGNDVTAFEVGMELVRLGSGASGSGITEDIKVALLACFEKVAWIDEDGQDYYDALYSALYPPTDLVSISAIFTQGQAVIYDTDSLNTLKQYLVVTAHMSDSTTQTITSYALSGTLTEGTTIITVTYMQKTTTFNVTVTHQIVGWLYRFNQSLLSDGSEEFNFVGDGVYGAGRLGTDYAYSHIVPTSGTASSDTQYGIKATGLTKIPNFGGNFTVAFWMATQVNKYAHPYGQYIYVNGNNPTYDKYCSSVTVHNNAWSGDITGQNLNAYAGFMCQLSSSSGRIIFRFTNGNLSRGGQLALTFPSDVDTTQWHHYALTKDDTHIRFFFDGELIATAETAETTIYNSEQVAVSAMFGNASATKNDIQQTSNGEKMQDLYIAEFCKWSASFDPSAINY